ncbi:MAG: type II toxin-antitoxin system VapC family toxin [Thermoanaerobaculia bacterium]|nr:type II toxin-antitoxin system VapC family toxin [Thermoanaerobaculia bacterium]MBP9824388.1 type II toxin-antitoxin system VapC family toxin [Thermoanaerobaculia bacterium]
MILPDVNVLVGAYRSDAERHDEYREWLFAETRSGAAFGISEPVLVGFLRVVTHPRVFARPSPLVAAMQFADALLALPGCRLLRAGPRYWEILRQTCAHADARGNLVSDAAHAALALEHDCVWITADRDFARFPGLRWRHPLDDRATRENPR